MSNPYELLGKLETMQSSPEDKLNEAAWACYGAITEQIKDKQKREKALKDLLGVLKKCETKNKKISDTLKGRINKEIKSMEKSFWQKLSGGFGKTWEFVKKIGNFTKWAALIGGSFYGLAYFGVFGKQGSAIAAKIFEVGKEKFSQVFELFMDKDRVKLRRKQRAILKILSAYEKIREIKKNKKLDNPTRNSLLSKQNKIIETQSAYLKKEHKVIVTDEASTKKALTDNHNQMDKKGYSNDKEEQPSVISKKITQLIKWFGGLSLRDKAICVLSGMFIWKGGKWYLSRKLFERSIRKANTPIERTIRELSNNIKTSNFAQAEIKKTMAQIEGKVAKPKPAQTKTTQPKKADKPKKTQPKKKATPKTKPVRFESLRNDILKKKKFANPQEKTNMRKHLDTIYNNAKNKPAALRFLQEIHAYPERLTVTQVGEIAKNGFFHTKSKPILKTLFAKLQRVTQFLRKKPPVTAPVTGPKKVAPKKKVRRRGK